MKLKRVALLSLAGLVLAGCESNRYYQKLERGEIDVWNQDHVQQVPESQLSADVLETFHTQYGDKARITRVEERCSGQNNHFYRIAFEKPTSDEPNAPVEKGTMDYKLDDARK